MHIVEDTQIIESITGKQFFSCKQERKTLRKVIFFPKCTNSISPSSVDTIGIGKIRLHVIYQDYLTPCDMDLNLLSIVILVLVAPCWGFMQQGIKLIEGLTGMTWILLVH